MLSIIVALAENRVIGRHNGLPWRLSADLQRFKRLTMGHHLIMGRRTFDSIGRALPGRTTIVITRRAGATPGVFPDGVLAAPTLEAALHLARADAEPFVAGGGEIYRLALPRADRIYLTLVHAVIDGDTTFPAWDQHEWNVVHEEHHPGGETDLSHTFRILDRIRSAAAASRGEPPR